MRGFATTVELDLGDGATALCFHGSPSSNMEGIYSVTPETRRSSGSSATTGSRSCSAATRTSRCCAAWSAR